MTTDQTQRLESLLTHREWVARLARSLVDDASVAEDVAQRTWLAVLQRPLMSRSDDRSWLGSVVRRIAHTARRSDARRRTREGASGGREPTPSVADTVAEMSTHRELVEQVLALAPERRDVVLLRYFEGLPPREIAQRLGIPAATVRTRLHRAIEQLEGRLESRLGGRHAMIAALLPLARFRPGEPRTEVEAHEGSLAAPSAAPFSPAFRLGAVGVAAVMVFGVVTMLEKEDEGARELDPSGVAEVEEESPAPVRRAPLEVALVGGTVERVESAVAEPAAVTRGLGGRVIDLDGRPLPGARLRYRGPHTVTWQAGDSGWIANSHRAVRISPTLLERLKSDPSHAASWFAQFPHPSEWRATLLGEPMPDRETVTDDEGGFRFEDDHRIDHARVDVVDPGFVRVAVGTRDDAGELLVVVARAVSLRGRVVDEGMTPVLDAFVEPASGLAELVSRLGVSLTAIAEVGAHRTGAGGAFWIPRAPSWEGLRLEVTHEDHQPRRFSSPLSDTQEMTLQLVQPATDALVFGTVFDMSGAAVAGAEVLLGRSTTKTADDGTFTVPWDVRGRLTVCASGFAPEAMALEAKPTQPLRLVLDRESRLSGSVRDPKGRPLDGVFVEISDGMLLDTGFRTAEARCGGWTRAVPVEREGRFVLAGLEARPYRLRIHHPDGSLVHVSEPLMPGADKVVTIPDDATVELLRGRLLDSDGLPMVGVEVAFGGSVRRNLGGGTSGAMSPPVVTGDDGRFAFPRVSRRGLFLQVTPDDRASARYDLASCARGDAVELVYPPRLTLKLEGFESFEAISVHDVEDRVLPIGGDTDAQTVTSRRPPRSMLLSVPETAAVLVLQKAGREVARKLLNPKHLGFLEVRAENLIPTSRSERR